MKVTTYEKHKEGIDKEQYVASMREKYLGKVVEWANGTTFYGSHMFLMGDRMVVLDVYIDSHLRVKVLHKQRIQHLWFVLNDEIDRTLQVVD